MLPHFPPLASASPRLSPPQLAAIVFACGTRAATTNSAVNFPPACQQSGPRLALEEPQTVGNNKTKPPSANGHHIFLSLSLPRPFQWPVARPFWPAPTGKSNICVLSYENLIIMNNSSTFPHCPTHSQQSGLSLSCLMQSTVVGVIFYTRFHVLDRSTRTYISTKCMA